MQLLFVHDSHRGEVFAVIIRNGDLAFFHVIVIAGAILQLECAVADEVQRDRTVGQRGEVLADNLDGQSQRSIELTVADRQGRRDGELCIGGSGRKIQVAVLVLCKKHIVEDGYGVTDDFACSFTFLIYYLLVIIYYL